uniref:glycerate kinase n=1 Tax=Eubacterium pyruvativorans TaxID=155865 RepID=UPI001567EE78
MKVVVAIDSFKGSLTSEEAGNAAKAGILRAIPEAEVIVRPMADGGEGTVDALAAGRTLQRITAHVTGPLGTPAEAQYVILDGSIAVMEMSRAAGITMVPRQNLDPRRATTFGVGEMIIDALDRGVRSFVLGIGGSATNDGGAGMLRALGYGLLDGNGAPIP